MEDQAKKAPLDSPALLSAIGALRAETGEARQTALRTQSVVRQRADAWTLACKPPASRYDGRFEDSFRGWAEAVLVDLQKSNVRGARLDNWQNLLTGHGTFRDKTQATFFMQDGQLDFPTLEAMYHNDDLAARAVDALPEEMFREGFDVHIEDSTEARDEFEQKFHELSVTAAFEEGAIWAQLYGGGGVFVGAQDGAEPQEPLDFKRVDDVTFLQVLDRYSLWPNTWYSDPAAPGFGMPETYRVFTPTVAGVTPPVNVIIHESRLITFPGARTSIRKRRVNFGWEDSVLQRPNQVLKQFGLSWAAATHLLSDAAQGVYKVKDLLAMIAGQNKEALMDRMALVDETRSTARMLLVDADNEDFTRTPTPFTGIPEMLDKVVQRLAAAFRVPVTVLMGISPAGLNATGDSDIRQWYDRIRTAQKHIAKPRLHKLIKILSAAKRGPTGGKDVDFGIHFKSLWQMTADEEATRRLKVAQADEIYFSVGAVLPEEIRKSRFGGEGYSAETTVDGDLTDAALEGTAKAARAVKGGSVVPGEQPSQISNDPRTGNVGQTGTLSQPNTPAPDLTAKPKPDKLPK